jgi:outer membrane protein TolC
MNFPRRVGRLSSIENSWRAAVRIGIILLGLSGGSAVQSSHAASDPAQISNPTEIIDLKLSDYLQLVLDRNESVQAYMLDAEANRRRAKAEKGAFEPDLVLSADHEVNKRQNNAQQQAQQLGQQFFTEENNIYNSALEALVPTGAKIHLGYTLSDLNNNVRQLFSTNAPVRQYQAFVGATLTQPLLKNAGTTVSLAKYRLAALDSDVAFQEYRRQLMLTISQAEAAYWNLYFTQEQMRFFDESVSLAKSIVDDSEEKLKAGQASELEVLEAQSGLAIRRTKQNQAKQNLFDALGKMKILYGASPATNEPVVHAVDVPPFERPLFSYAQSFQQAYDLNPDYLIQRKKVAQERVRYGVARNQLYPELNFKAAYGYNGLGLTPGDSLDQLDSQDFPSWSLGIELRIPLAGGIRSRNEYNAAKLTLQQAILNLNSVQTQIANSLDASIHKAQSWNESIDSYQTVVHFNEDLLKTELERLKVGQVEPRKVLEVEADLFDARQSLAEALVQYQRTLLEVQLADGSVLKSRHLDITREELRKKTVALLTDHPVQLDVFRPVLEGKPVPPIN